MTEITVVDASALAALLFVEPEAETILARLEGRRLGAPRLLPFELANVCWTKARRDPPSEASLVSQLGAYVGIGVQEFDIDPGAVSRLALRTGFTAYDASYLWLARYLGAELVTLDRALRRAADAVV